MDTRKFLKIKLKSLMAESKIIRREEARTLDRELRESMHRHRVIDVRHETRCTQLAYALLRGHPYNRIETRRPAGVGRNTTPIDFKKVAAMLRRYALPEQRLGNASEETVSRWVMATLHEPRAS